MDDHQFGVFLARAVQELNEKQKRLQTEYRLGSFARWWFDQQTATLQFFDENDRLGLQTEFVDIGSFSVRAGTWQWAWANSSVLPAVRQRSSELKKLSSLTGMDVFVEEEAFAVSEEMAWELAAISVMHLDAVGCYRAPSSNGTLNMFLALMRIRSVN
ncbi:hypothetical protein KXR53_18500 [Inquilinus limosus]|uniref:DUF6882 domain-containing protein n=1 Tax=Inquilinus limosus TaxID=171674 RepID=UPI003F15278E